MCILIIFTHFSYLNELQYKTKADESYFNLPEPFWSKYKPRHTYKNKYMEYLMQSQLSLLIDGSLQYYIAKKKLK